MSRTKGARDISIRKKRSDINKRRKMYAKKPTKKKRRVNGKLVLYKSKRKHGDPVSIWFQEKKRMRHDGYMKWHKGIRRYVDRTTKTWIDKPTRVNPQSISTPEKLGEVTIDILQYPGLFNLTMPTHSKNRYGVSYKKKANIKITETEEGLHAVVSDFSKMRHYGWFFKNEIMR